MLIAGRKIVDKAAKRHADWRVSLITWARVVSEAGWTCSSDIQQTFNTADPVGNYVIFNIAGNKARLVAIVNFSEKRVTVKQVLSHAEYDRETYK
jgi:mRNA interferase HigB